MTTTFDCPDPERRPLVPPSENSLVLSAAVNAYIGVAVVYTETRDHAVRLIQAREARDWDAAREAARELETLLKRLGLWQLDRLSSARSWLFGEYDIEF